MFFCDSPEDQYNEGLWEDPSRTAQKCCSWCVFLMTSLPCKITQGANLPGSCSDSVTAAQKETPLTVQNISVV